MEETLEPSVEQQSTGLLDGATPESEEVNAESNPQKVEIDHRDPAEVQAKEEFALQQEKKDEEPVERPDWFPANFWKEDESEPDLQAMAKSWKDLRDKIAKGKHKAPEDGNYDLSAFGNTPEDDPVRQHVMTWAREYGVSQAALDDLVGQVVEMNMNASQVAQINVDEERKLLGPNADARINGMVKWASGLVQKGVWGSDDFEEFKVMGGTARGIAALEKLRASYEGRVPVESVPVEGAPSKDELYDMVKDPRYQTDPTYRKKVERAFQQNFA